MQNHDAAWLTEWKPLLDIVIGDFVRGESYLLNTSASSPRISSRPTRIPECAQLPQRDDRFRYSGRFMTGIGTLTGTDDADIFMRRQRRHLRGGQGPDTYMFGKPSATT